MNILICYMPKTELRMRSYDAMNIAKILGFRAKVNPRYLDLDPDPGARVTRLAGASPEMEENGRTARGRRGAPRPKRWPGGAATAAGVDGGARAARVGRAAPAATLGDGGTADRGGGGGRRWRAAAGARGDGGRRGRRGSGPGGPPAGSPGRRGRWRRRRTGRRQVAAADLGF